MKIFKERKERFNFPNSEAWIEIKYLNEGQQQNVISKASTLRVDLVEGGNTAHRVPDEVKLREESVDARITAFGKIIDEETGKELECNRANKILLSEQDDFMDFFGDCIKKLDKIVKEEREQEVKNLQDSQDGSPE